MPDVSNKFISIETMVSLIIVSSGGLFAYGKLAAQVQQKVDKADVAVTQTKVEAIEEDVQEIKVTLAKHIKEQTASDLQQAVLLQKILSQVENGD